VFIEWLARRSGIATPLHSAGVDTFSSLYGRDFRSENTLCEHLDL